MSYRVRIKVEDLSTQAIPFSEIIEFEDISEKDIENIFDTKDDNPLVCCIRYPDGITRVMPLARLVYIEIEEQ